MVEGIRFRLPVTANGDLDIAAQDALAQKLIYLEQLKQTVQEKRDDIAEIVIALDNTDYNMAYFSITDLFTTEKGKAKYTKKYGNLHSGEYPVYSASSSKPLTHMDTFDYDGKYLTWSTNGFAGTILVIEGRFSINGDRGILVPKDGRTDLDFEYMKYVIQPVFRELAKGRKGDNGEDEFTKLYPSMLNDVMIPVPVDREGNVDLQAQQDIAKRYFAADQCKRDVIEKLDTLIAQRIDLM